LLQIDLQMNTDGLQKSVFRVVNFSSGGREYYLTLSSVCFINKKLSK